MGSATPPCAIPKPMHPMRLCTFNPVYRRSTGASEVLGGPTTVRNTACISERSSDSLCLFRKKNTGFRSHFPPVPSVTVGCPNFPLGFPRIEHGLMIEGSPLCVLCPVRENTSARRLPPATAMGRRVGGLAICARSGLGGRTTVVLEDLWDPLGFYIYKEMLLAVMVFIDALYISVKFLIISVLVR